MRRASSLLAALFVALLAGLVASAARAETVTLEGYRERLAAALVTLETADDPQGALSEVRQGLATITAVQLPGGELLLLREPLLSESEIPLEVALARLRIVEEQIGLSTSDALALRQAALAVVFERREFRSTESLLARLLRRLQAWWDTLFPEQSQTTLPSTPSSEAASNLAGWLMTAIGSVVILALLVWWLRRFIASFVGDAELQRRRAAGETLPLTAAEARAQATEHARVGSFREAVRSLYLAALLSLEEREIVVHDRALTNRELLARAARDPVLRDHLAPVVSTFDEVWYGVREPDAETFAAYAHEVDALHALPARAPETHS